MPQRKLLKLISIKLKNYRQTFWCQYYAFITIVDDIVDLVIEEGVKVVTTGAGNPGKYMERFHEAGITVIPVVPSVALAKRMEN